MSNEIARPENESLEYNSHRAHMVIPEYGRNIQKMVDHALTVSDREERNKCVAAIISVMGQLFPYLRDAEDFKHKLWDHLYIISDFKLDVDSPYPVPVPETFLEKPEKMPYPDLKLRFGHYGKSVQKLIEKAVNYEKGEERDALITSIGKLMKQNFITYNRELVNDEIIINDMIKISNDKLEITDRVKLLEAIKSFHVKSAPSENTHRKPHNNQNRKKPQHTNQNRKKRF
jgi:hypothetical protein